MTATIQKTAYTCRKTGKIRAIEPEFGRAYQLPEVEIVERHSVSEIDSFDAVCEVEGDGFFYLWDCEYLYDENNRCGVKVLVREISAWDAGDNKIREVNAPESTQGICRPVVPRTNTRLSKGHSDPLFVLRG